MKMHIPPECQGQMVELSYGGDGSGLLFRRAVDRSDREERWFRAAADECGHEGECGCFEPWNKEPTAYAWTPCSAPRDDDE